MSLGGLKHGKRTASVELGAAAASACSSVLLLLMLLLLVLRASRRSLSQNHTPTAATMMKYALISRTSIGASTAAPRTAPVEDDITLGV